MLGTSNVDFGFACCADIGLAWTCYYLCFIEVKWIIATASFFSMYSYSTQEHRSRE